MKEERRGNEGGGDYEHVTVLKEWDNSNEERKTEQR